MINTDKAQPGWKKATIPYQYPDLRRSLWQIANSLIPFFILFYFMYLSLDISYWLTLALAIPAGGFLVRIFIIFHDCGHGSFFRQRWANELVGYVTGIITLTPPHAWWREHAIHHATAGDLDASWESLLELVPTFQGATNAQAAQPPVQRELAETIGQHVALALERDALARKANNLSRLQERQRMLDGEQTQLREREQLMQQEQTRVQERLQVLQQTEQGAE